jgi:hypothetical protein
MPYLVTATTQKPSAEVKLYGENNEAGLLGDLFKREKQKYKDAGELLSERSDTTSDGTKITYAALWSSQEAYEKYLNNVICNQYWTIVNRYNTTNNITFTKRTAEV